MVNVWQMLAFVLQGLLKMAEQALTHEALNCPDSFASVGQAFLADDTTLLRCSVNLASPFVNVLCSLLM